MKNLLLIIASICIANIALAQDPCYIKYTYDASGNRIKREFVCAPVDTLIVIAGDTVIDSGGGGIARMQNPNPPTIIRMYPLLVILHLTLRQASL